MSNKGLLKTLKSKLVIILAIIALLCLSCFTLFACSDDGDGSSTVTDPTYSYTETNTTEKISNSSFSSGVSSVANTDFPIKSPSSWSRAVDNSAKSSNVDSGVVSTKTSAWNDLIKKFYSDPEFKSYVESKGLVDSAKTDDENIAKIISDMFVNPTSKDGDDSVFMLNNYLSGTQLGLGTAQKVTSSSKITLKKGTAGVFTVWVKTLNIKAFNADNAGANIRIVNSFNGISQADVAVTNIKDTEWTEYKLYVKADDMYDSTLTLVLGLGFGSGKNANSEFYTEGTAYFDNISFSEIETNEIPTISQDSQKAVLEFGQSDIQKLTKTDSNLYLYDMNPVEKDSAGAIVPLGNEFSKLNITNDDSHLYYTKSKIQSNGEYITSKTLFPTTSNVDKVYDASNPNSITLNNVKDASYTIKIDNNGNNFKLAGDKSANPVIENEYAIIKFSLKNELSTFGSTQVIINVADVSGDIVKMRNAVAVIEKTDEITEYSILVQNNIGNGEREFFIELIIGSDKLGSVNYTNELASGSLTISDLVYEQKNIPVDDETDNIYSFYGRSPIANVSLYAGYTSEPVEDDDSTSYSLNVAPGNVGNIISAPTNIKNYIGVRPDHAYINGSSYADVNTRSGNGDENGNIAGLINTKYIDNYPAEIKTALNYTGTEDIQPMVIYNKVESSYGFIGSKNIVSANSQARVTVSIKVVGDAKATIYLVDTDDENKGVLQFEDFTVNNDYVTSVANGTEIKGENLKFKFDVTNTSSYEDGWKTFTFYLGTGITQRTFRVEVWNGSREVTGTKSQGFVFVKDINVTTSSGFAEPTRIEDAFSVTGNPLYVEKASSFEKEGSTLYSYTRELTDIEKEYNENNPDTPVSYLPTYIWAQNDKTIYAVFNTIDAEEVDPNQTTDDDVTEEGSGCTAESDPSTFWLSFSSIILGVVLALAIIALILKRVRSKRKANASDAKSHYKVVSRSSRKIKEEKAESEKVQKKDDEQLDEQTDEQEEITEEIEQTESDEVIEEQPVEEQTLDSYVYGDVQDFGENSEQSQVEENSQEQSNEEKPE